MARFRRLDGIETVQRVFRQLPRENIERITNALNQGAEEIAQAARQAVPVGEGKGAGDLLASIRVAGGVGVLERNTKGEFAAPGMGGRFSAVKFILAGEKENGSIDYARQQEWGRKPGPGEHRGHRAQPFMFPAYWSIRRKVVSRVRREIRNAARAVARLGRG